MGDLDRFCEFSERFLIDEARRPLVVEGLQGGVVIRGWVQVFEPSLSRAGRLPWLAVGYAEVRLLNGEVFTVEGTLDEVESKLSDAARSGQSRLAWFTEYGTGGSVGVNPAHVAILKVSENSD